MVRIYWISEIISDIKITYHNKNIVNINFSILKIL